RDPTFVPSHNPSLLPESGPLWRLSPRANDKARVVCLPGSNTMCLGGVRRTLSARSVVLRTKTFRQHRRKDSFGQTGSGAHPATLQPSPKRLQFRNPTTARPHRKCLRRHIRIGSASYDFSSHSKTTNPGPGAVGTAHSSGLSARI